SSTAPRSRATTGSASSSSPSRSWQERTSAGSGSDAPEALQARSGLLFADRARPSSRERPLDTAPRLGHQPLVFRRKGARLVALVSTVAYLGLEARAVEVQCQVAPGMPGFHLVGL